MYLGRSGLVFWVSGLVLGWLDLYFKCSNLYFGGLDLFLRCLDLLFGCLDLFLELVPDSLDWSGPILDWCRPNSDQKKSTWKISRGEVNTAPHSYQLKLGAIYPLLAPKGTAYWLLQAHLIGLVVKSKVIEHGCCDNPHSWHFVLGARDS